MRIRILHNDADPTGSGSRILREWPANCVSEMAAGKSEQEGPKNPPYLDMIVAAIKADQSRTGTSKQVRGSSCAGRARLALAI